MLPSMCMIAHAANHTFPTYPPCQAGGRAQAQHGKAQGGARGLPWRAIGGTRAEALRRRGCIFPRYQGGSP